MFSVQFRQPRVLNTPGCDKFLPQLDDSAKRQTPLYYFTPVPARIRPAQRPARFRIEAKVSYDFGRGGAIAGHQSRFNFGTDEPLPIDKSRLGQPFNFRRHGV
jgi:hypothetical protein